MSLANLDKLVQAGQLKKEPMNKLEFDGLINSGETRLKDATNPTLAQESRFDLAYNAAHSLALAALRWHGYRPAHRFIVFQTLSITLKLEPQEWRLLAKCHDIRNIAEYEGQLDIQDQVLLELIEITTTIKERTKQLK